VINSNLGPILHRLATVHPWRMTDGRELTTKGRPYSLQLGGRPINKLTILLVINAGLGKCNEAEEISISKLLRAAAGLLKVWYE